MNPYFSIVMAVYNKAPYLKRSIGSVLSQRFTNFELICVDGTSSDGSAEILRDYSVSDQRVRFMSQVNQGISAAKNFGIINSRADYVAFIDADDSWENHFLLEIYNLIQAYPQCLGFVTAYECVNGNTTRIVQIPKSRSIGLIDDYFNCRYSGWGVHTSSVTLSKKAILNAGGFPYAISDVDMNATYIVDMHGKVVSTINGFLVTDSLKPLEKDLLINTSELNSDVERLSIEVPGPGAEDQYLHDIVAMRGKYAYSNTISSRWYGDIPNQDTSKAHSPLFCPLIGLIELFHDRSSNFKRYLRYISIHAVPAIYKANNPGLAAAHHVDFVWGRFRPSARTLLSFYKWYFRARKWFLVIVHYILKTVCNTKPSKEIWQ